MNFASRFTRKIEQLAPSNYRTYYREMLFYAGKEQNIFRLPMVIIVSLGVFIFSIIAGVLLDKLLIGSAAGLALCVFILFIDYLLLYFIVENRTNTIEDSLPDFLHLVSSNIRSGLTIFHAFRMSSRPEFGPLKEEIDKLSRRAMGPIDIHDAFEEMGQSSKSTIFGRIMGLFITSIKSGSHMASLLEEAARDIAETKELKRNLAASTKTYSMFIMFTVIIGAPLLFAISLYFVESMGTMNTPTAGDSGSAFGLGLSTGGTKITPEFMIWNSLAMITVTALLSSILIGVIGEGKKAHGMRYFPFVSMAAYGVFFSVRFLVSFFLG